MFTKFSVVAICALLCVGVHGLTPSPYVYSCGNDSQCNIANCTNFSIPNDVCIPSNTSDEGILSGKARCTADGIVYVQYSDAQCGNFVQAVNLPSGQCQFDKKDNEYKLYACTPAPGNPIYDLVAEATTCEGQNGCAAGEGKILQLPQDQCFDQDPKTNEFPSFKLKCSMNGILIDNYNNNGCFDAPLSTVVPFNKFMPSAKKNTSTAFQCVKRTKQYVTVKQCTNQKCNSCGEVTPIFAAATCIPNENNMEKQSMKVFCDKNFGLQFFMFSDQQCRVPLSKMVYNENQCQLDDKADKYQMLGCVDANESMQKDHSMTQKIFERVKSI